MTRKLYLTESMLVRAGACKGVRDQLNELFGLRTRRVPITNTTARAVELTLSRITWAVDYLLTTKQRRVYWRERGKFTSLYDQHQRALKRADAFVTAYYSPKK
ncbi:MAG TPA: hypothetical protein VNZ53_19305 [Steroidobacteraceae bacterium]|nr:hypothetical protein [Steroidobacteraceae bacterium]